MWVEWLSGEGSCELDVLFIIVFSILWRKMENKWIMIFYGICGWCYKVISKIIIGIYGNMNIVFF